VRQLVGAFTAAACCKARVKGAQVEMVFSSHLLNEAEVGGEGQRPGRIIIGDFTKLFICEADDGTVEELPGQWNNELARLISGEPAVRLMHNPIMA
jgi:hypothetical protein